MSSSSQQVGSPGAQLSRTGPPDARDAGASERRSGCRGPRRFSEAQEKGLPEMTRWTIDAPTTLDFDGIAALAGPGDLGLRRRTQPPTSAPCLDIASVSGQPLLVSHEAGVLTGQL